MKTNYLDQIEYDSINADAIEIIKLLTSIIVSTRNNIKNKNPK